MNLPLTGATRNYRGNYYRCKFTHSVVSAVNPKKTSGSLLGIITFHLINSVHFIYMFFPSFRALLPLSRRNICKHSFSVSSSAFGIYGDSEMLYFHFNFRIGKPFLRRAKLPPRQNHYLSFSRGMKSFRKYKSTRMGFAAAMVGVVKTWWDMGEKRNVLQQWQFEFEF